MKNYLSDFTSLLSQIVVNMFLRSFSPKNGRFIWFDIETTGFNQFHSEIIEIAAVDNLGNTFNELINIGHKKLPKKTVIIEKSIFIFLFSVFLPIRFPTQVSVFTAFV